MGLLTRPLERLLGLADLNALYAAMEAESAGADLFLDRALRVLDVSVSLDPADLARIPPTGPLVVVANHPTGALDGMIVAQAVGRVRRDVRFLANALLGRVPDMRPLCVFVDVFGSRPGRNEAALRAAEAWVAAGGALIVFPSGEVSCVRAHDGRLLDPQWRRGAARLAERAGATILPMRVGAEPSRLLRAARRVHPLVGTALLARELLGQRGRTVSLSIGEPLSDERLREIGDLSARTRFLRAATDRLSGEAHRPEAATAVAVTSTSEPIADPIPPDAMVADLAALPPGSRIIERGEWQVFCAGAERLPNVLPEIGRLRELTFRAAGEGTGRSRDLDAFDAYYQHLFVWHRDRRQVVGAYRLARTDEVLRARGVHGLYTRTLFEYDERLLDQIGPAMELGRSFVRREYQREYSPLLLLWKAVGLLVAAEPRYRHLFGCVSISADYTSTTRTLLASFLSANQFTSKLAALVAAKRPLRLPSDHRGVAMAAAVSSLEDVDAMVQQIEAGGRGMPVLLRQYLALKAKLLGFSVDPDFGNVLDGLVLVDLLGLSPALLARYLGRDGAGRFLAAHGRAVRDAA